MPRHIVSSLVASIVLVATAYADSRWTLALDLKGEHIEGYPLFSSKREVQLLSRDGQLLTFSPGDARNSRKSSGGFRSYTASEMRSQLAREFGQTFDVSGTGHYLVVHPRGQRDLWAPRFEELYRSCVHYFSRRGITVTDPEFPLVAVVWRNQADFMRYAAKDGAKIGTNVLGYYSPKTNRITLYDTTGASGANWQQNADVIIHEATHQTAFNTGLHRRFADNPRWLVEGLATMFEARGVYDSNDYQNQADRVNRGRWRSFQRLEQNGKPSAIADLLAGDKLFERDVDRAYAQAWALTFYLCETQPYRYSDYLKLVYRRAAFDQYQSTQRLKDFASVFGDVPLLESHFRRYMDELQVR
ncbi:MAG TPA: DUF1570 domain-containing protein [Pirellulales bacterium]|nr:DUF1570 domain-containing protein [Pirellulales bacterium]